MFVGFYSHDLPQLPLTQLILQVLENLVLAPYSKRTGVQTLRTYFFKMLILSKTEFISNKCIGITCLHSFLTCQGTENFHVQVADMYLTEKQNVHFYSFHLHSIPSKPL